MCFVRFHLKLSAAPLPSQTQGARSKARKLLPNANRARTSEQKGARPSQSPAANLRPSNVRSSELGAARRGTVASFALEFYAHAKEVGSRIKATPGRASIRAPIEKNITLMKYNEERRKSASVTVRTASHSR